MYQEVLVKKIGINRSVMYQEEVKIGINRSVMYQEVDS